MFKKLGLQLFTVRDYMTDEKAIDETFARLVKMGYTEGQTAGLNVELPAYAELAKKHGMSIVGTHYDFGKIVNDPKATMELHDRLGKNRKITQSFTEIGNGNIWWDGVLETAERIGVKHYVVEQDRRWIDGDPFKSLQASRDYLAKYMDQ